MAAYDSRRDTSISVELTDPQPGDVVKIARLDDAGSPVYAHGAASATVSPGTKITYTGTATQRVFAVEATDPNFPTQVVQVKNAGKSHTLSVVHNATGAAAQAVDVVSTNESDTAMGVRGVEVGRGSIKVTHDKPPSGADDANASAVSIRANGTGTKAKMIFGDAEDGGTLGDLIDLRQAGVTKFRVNKDGSIASVGNVVASSYLQPGALGSAPTPVAQRGQLYTRQNGSAKTELVVQFGTGAPIILATQA